MTVSTPFFSARPGRAPAFTSALDPLADVALVMPCYNEAERLNAGAIAGFVRAHPGLRLILVNDGSRDATLARLMALQADCPDQVSVLDLAQNSGKAEAVRQGMLFALATGAPLIAYWDADLATPLDCAEDFARVAQRHPGLQVIFGSRRQMLGHRIHRTPMRRAVSRACATLARLALGLPVADSQCGAKMLRAGPALAAALAQPFRAGWLFDVELFARIKAALGGAAAEGFYEYPLPEWQEVAGSKVTGRAILRAGLAMLRLIAETRGLVAPGPLPDAARVRTVAPPMTAAQAGGLAA